MEAAGARERLRAGPPRRICERIEDNVAVDGLGCRDRRRTGFGELLRGLGPDNQSGAWILVAVSLVAAVGRFGGIRVGFARATRDCCAACDPGGFAGMPDQTGHAQRGLSDQSPHNQTCRENAPTHHANCRQGVRRGQTPAGRLVTGQGSAQ